MSCIAYRGGYKYQLKQHYSLPQSAILPDRPVDTAFIALDASGVLLIRAGYAWDGPSGPTIDTKNFMRGSLVHDALYQLMREGHLDLVAHRDPADRLLQTLCIEDGMSRIRAWWVYEAVKRFGKPSASPAQNHPMEWAPRPC
ncbi:MAG: hypothetical protein KGZ80_06210 [Methylomonas sp.]|nr:hypothetical protein [Methylomonas sp.]PPD20648.1 MAG: hypothetical protein CTY23_08125 [Methylomonas sp.]PPD25517.1 MAG: hypothetical protein CTY22_08320 [Methylomonas sp.]PPD36310.1 MAG: hypothetical protein CTY21_08320 [Methylomonas sp.]PPD40242.1 MAG: hypothetical protein CTY17_06885 [Methylomonas sp.]